jgi:PAN domain
MFNWIAPILCYFLIGLMPLAAQDKPKGLSFHSTPSRQLISVPEARKTVDAILAKVPYRYPLEVFVVEDSWDVPNAEARLSNEGKHLILFNKQFMEQVRQGTGTDWSLVGITAHEIGHHVGNHIVRKEDGEVVFTVPGNSAELEADYYAGFALGKMGSTVDEAIAAMRWLPDPGPGKNHPPRDQRVEETSRGWQNAKADQPLAQKRIEPARFDIESKFASRVNRDIYGHDILKLPGVRQDECAMKCYENSACKAYSFDKWNGWCFLKDTLVPTLLDPPSVLGVRKPLAIPNASTAEAKMFRLRNKIFKDSPIESSIQQSYENCEEVCRTSMRCVAFTYIKRSKQCQLFNGSVGFYFDQTADSGFKHQTPRGPSR